MKKNGIFLLFVFSVSLLSLSSPVDAFIDIPALIGFCPGLDAKGPGIFGPQTPLECSPGERHCIAENYQCFCGNYDWDPCLEYPYVITDCDFCELGCYNGICYQHGDDDGSGDTCQEGWSTCGGIQNEEEIIKPCVYDRALGYWHYGYDEYEGNVVCKNYEGCYVKNNVASCRTRDENQASQCYREQEQCDGNAIKECDITTGPIYKWESPDRWHYCPDGYVCTEKWGDPSCHKVDEEGDEDGSPPPVFACIPNSWECYNDDFRRKCLDMPNGGSRWFDPSIDSDVETNGFRYCEFGCYGAGNCNKDPITEEELRRGADCIPGRTYCTGSARSGSSTRTCYERDDGTTEWRINRCPGKCQGSSCVRELRQGYDYKIGMDQLSISPDDRGRLDPSSINFAYDGQSYILNYLLYTNVGGDYWEDFRLLNYTGLYYYNNTRAPEIPYNYIQDYDYYDGLLYGINATHIHHVTLQGDYHILNETPYSNNADIAVNEDYIFVFQTRGYDHYVLHRQNLTLVSDYNICLVEKDQQYCGEFTHGYGQDMEDVEIVGNNMYVLYNEMESDGWNQDQHYPYQPPYRMVLDQYTIDGTYTGRIYLERGFWYHDMEYDETTNTMHFLKGKYLGNVQTALMQDYYIEIRHMWDVCPNECLNGSEMCGGTLDQGFRLHCIETEDGCFKWFDPALFPTLDQLLYMIVCPFGCEEYYESPTVTKTRCRESPICENPCELDSWKCSEGDLTQKTRVQCKLLSVPYTTKNVLMDNVNNYAKCNMFDYENAERCGAFQKCVEGVCQGYHECNITEQRCVNFDYEGQEFLGTDPVEVVGQWFVQTCSNVDGYGRWLGNMTRCEHVCHSDYNFTTGMQEAWCINDVPREYLEARNFVSVLRENMEIAGGTSRNMHVLSYIFVVIIMAVVFVVSRNMGFVGVSGVGTIMVFVVMNWIPYMIGLVLIVLSCYIVFREVIGEKIGN